jgi:hypothetical protein
MIEIRFDKTKDEVALLIWFLVDHSVYRCKVTLANVTIPALVFQSFFLVRRIRKTHRVIGETTQLIKSALYRDQTVLFLSYKNKRNLKSVINKFKKHIFTTIDK